jgi:hypothetical protein
MRFAKCSYGQKTFMVSDIEAMSRAVNKRLAKQNMRMSGF